MECYSKFIGFKACGATESASGYFIDSLGFTLWQGSHLANESDVSGINMYWRVHDNAMVMLEEYFFDRLMKFQKYKSFISSELVGGFNDSVRTIQNLDYQVNNGVYVNHFISSIFIKPKVDATVNINGEATALIGGEINDVVIDSDRVQIDGPIDVYGCGENGFQMEVISECDPHRFFCKFLRYLKKPALYLVYAHLAEEAITTGRSSAMVVNMNEKYRRIHYDMMGGTNPDTGQRIKGKFWTSLDNTIERIGIQLRETECIECSAAKYVSSIP
jgi:hypothetical protein